MAAGLLPERILRQLDDLWVSFAGKDSGEGAGVLRACAMTLIVLTPRSAEEALGETLAALMPEHPSRLIRLELDAAAPRLVDATVTAHCWMPFGVRQQICCEQIVVTAAAAEPLAGLTGALLAPDLPVVMWCRDPDLLQPDQARRLVELADKIIVDTSGARPASMLPLLCRLRSEGSIVADLSWTRLTPWRAAIAQLFAAASRRRLAAKAAAVTVRHHGVEPPMRALYLAGWILECLGGASRCTFQPLGRLPRQTESDVAGVTIEGEDLSLSIGQADGELIGIHAGGLSRYAVFPELNECRLLCEELCIEGRDPSYEAALDRAALLAGGTPPAAARG